MRTLKTSLVFLKQTQPRTIVNQEKKIKKQSEDKIIKAIDERIVTDISNLLEQKEDYYKAVRVSNFWSNNYFEYQSIIYKLKYKFNLNIFSTKQGIPC